MEKRGQLQVSFHWVYILIAGGIILLFFVGLLLRGGTVAEKELEGDVLRIMESILIGAGVAEKTKNFIDTEGLADYIIEFKCEGDYAGFGIKGGTFRELPLGPIFAPKEIKTTKLILWSLPYNMPYKVMDLLMVTTGNTKYFVFGGEGSSFKQELVDSTEDLNFEFNVDYNEIEPGKNFHIRIVDLDGIFNTVPPSLFEDEQVSMVSFSNKQISYFQKDGNGWKSLGEPVQLISIAEEKDAAKYAAIFSGDGESYQCNMMKVFQRMKYVTDIYEGKLNEISTYYEDPLAPEQSACRLILDSSEGLKRKIILLKSKLGTCVNRGLYSYCDNIVDEAEDIKELNENLRGDTCIQLY